ncbi:MAG: cell division protein ZipA [Xanthomonadales bacterium]|nr:cell division protein ZipA [Xanthomonadales bacterium]
MEWNPAVGIPLIVFGAVVLLLIYIFGRPQKPRQGERRARPDGRAARVEPTLGDDETTGDGADDGLPSLHASRGEDEAGESEPRHVPPPSTVGARPDHPIERIVTLYVAAQAGEMLRGADIVVAAEKAGLEFGDLGIFHRRVIGKPVDGPVFSMANMVRPGHFDMARLDEVETPGVTLFMTLPGPLPALDAWEMLLPAAQRLAELLDARVLDEDRNGLGRQRIAHVRDELRAWDRRQERDRIRPGA